MKNRREKSARNISKNRLAHCDKILLILSDEKWHDTAEIAGYLGLKESRTRELLKGLLELDKIQDNGKINKGKMYKLK